MPTKTTYWEVIGHRVQPDGDIEHLLQEVEDFTGAPATRPGAEIMKHVTSAANEQPRGTIVKIIDTNSRQVFLNPTS